MNKDNQKPGDLLSETIELVGSGKPAKECTDKELEQIEGLMFFSSDSNLRPYLREIERRKKAQDVKEDRKFQLEVVTLVAVFAAVFGLLTGVFNAATTRLIENADINGLTLLMYLSGAAIIAAGIMSVAYLLKRGA